MGYRVNVQTGAATCVHPYRIGLTPGAYASAGLSVPDDVTYLEGWLIAVLRHAGPDRMHGALAAAETEVDVVAPAVSDRGL